MLLKETKNAKGDEAFEEIHSLLTVTVCVTVQL